MSALTQNRLRALVLAAAPLVLLVGSIVEPYIDDESSTEKVIEAQVAHPDRFALSQLILLGGIALLLLAIVSARQVLRAAGEERWSFIAVPLVLIGGAFVAGTVGSALAGGAIADTTPDMPTIGEEIDEWVTPVFVVGGLGIGLGMLSLAMALHRTQVLGQRQTWVAIVALVAGVVGIFLPASGGDYLFTLGASGGSFLFALGMGVAFWLLAYQVWSESTAPAPSESPVSAG